MPSTDKTCKKKWSVKGSNLITVTLIFFIILWVIMTLFVTATYSRNVTHNNSNVLMIILYVFLVASIIVYGFTLDSYHSHELVTCERPDAK